MNNPAPPPYKSLVFSDPKYRAGIIRARKQMIRNTITELLDQHNIKHGFEVDQANIEAMITEAEEQLCLDW